MSMSNADDPKRRPNLFKRLIKQPLISSVLSSLTVAGILALISKATHLIGHVSYTSILLVAGVIVLIGGIASLIRYRKQLNIWQFTSVAALVVASSALTSITVHNEIPKDTASCQDLSRVGLTVSAFELEACECIDVPGIRQGPLPPLKAIESVSCDSSHDAEVYFAGNIWPPNAAYPGDNAVISGAGSQCDHEFVRYIGQSTSHTALKYTYWYPSRTSWARIDDRNVECVVYNPLKPVDRSLRGSRT